MKLNKNSNILIVGLGLMGGSYAERLSLQGYRVFALDIDEDAIRIGKKRKLILNTDESEETLIRQSDFIILGLLPTLCHNWVKEHKSLFKKDVIITDMMGVKSHFVSDIQNELTSSQEFISMHPMTGKEVSGVLFASENIFNSSNMLIVPTSKNTERGIEFAKSLADVLKVKNIKIISIEEHDTLVGYVSHLSHVISVCLMNSFESDSLKEVAGTSFKDITRIANINEDIWSELFLENKVELVKLIEAYEESLSSLKKAIESGNKLEVKEILKESRIKRQEFNK